MTWNPYKLLRRLIGMGRLSGNDDQQQPRPHVSMGIMTPATKQVKKVVAVVAKRIWRACDKCGYSEVDGQPISHAKYQIEVPGGDLYFCAHHFREYSTLILTEGYPIHDIREKVASK
jgi:predicted nucleic-acid-binding Zn-ribbon protein